MITSTDLEAPKRKSLTMFLVPLDTAGIEIEGRAVDGDRTNIVYYSDVRVDDKYRLGAVNDGWTVVREPLNAQRRRSRRTGAGDARHLALHDGHPRYRVAERAS